MKETGRLELLPTRTPDYIIYYTTAYITCYRETREHSCFEIYQNIAVYTSLQPESLLRNMECVSEFQHKAVHNRNEATRSVFVRGSAAVVDVLRIGMTMLLELSRLLTCADGEFDWPYFVLFDEKVDEDILHQYRPCSWHGERPNRQFSTGSCLIGVLFYFSGNSVVIVGLETSSFRNTSFQVQHVQQGY